MEVHDLSALLAIAAAWLLPGCSDVVPSFDFDNDGWEDNVDCGPDDPTVHPGAEDGYGNGVDEDCDECGVDASIAGDGIDRDCDGYPANDDLTHPDLFDCNDNDALVNPGVAEDLSDDIDNDCDGWAQKDGDGDGYYADIDDCDDEDPDVYDGAEELVDCKDNDCDSLIDEGLATADGDNDGYCEGADIGSGEHECCEDIEPGDCDDSEPLVNPGQTELLDCLDNDCNELVDEGLETADDDGDGYCEGADVGGGEPECCDGSTPGDCDDEDAAIHPDAVESCGDCSITDCTSDLALDCDDDGDGEAECAGDCDDTNPAIYSTAVEICDLYDNNCDGSHDPFDEDDLDGDGDPACSDCDDADSTLETLDGDGDGYSTCDGDCDDTNGQYFPGNSDIFGDAIDANCDGVDGEDADLDGFPGNAPPADPSFDCDDADATVHPGVEDGCDGIDNDCDGVTDPLDVDDDGDGYTICDADCDDTDADTYPGAPEICDGLDNSCDGDLPPSEADDDGDGWMVCELDCDDSDATLNLDDVDGDGYSTCEEDCDDLDPALNFDDADSDDWTSCGGDCDDGDVYFSPDAVEVCDGLDQDCDGAVDEDCVTCDTYVPSDWPDIQDALSSTPAGTTICVAAGSYFENLDFGSGDRHLAGLAGPRRTHIDAQGVGEVVSIAGGQTAATVLEGFTITRGHDFDGAGVDVYGASPTLRNLIVTDNVSTSTGAIAIEGPGSPTLSNISITDNSGSTGAGLTAIGATLTLVDIEIRENSSNTYGGGMVLDSCNAQLTRVQVTTNQAVSTGGGALFNESTVVATDLELSHNVTAADGGGLQMSDSSLTVSGLSLVGNAAAMMGGGASLFTSDLVAERSVVAQNSAEDAGGLGLIMAHAEMTNGFIVGNSATLDVGGVVIWGASPVFDNVTITGNDAGRAVGGVYVGNSTYPNPVIVSAPQFDNVIISHNTGNLEGGLTLDTGTPTLTYCDVWGNTPDDYAGMADPSGTDGNVSIDPVFIDVSGPEVAYWDLHLASSSPLIDAGDPTVFDPDGSPSDPGANGGPGAALWDIDRDGYYGWWQPGEYDYVTYPGQGWDCDDRDAGVYPGNGC